MDWLPIAGWVLLGLAALLTILLAIPVELSLRVERAQRTRVEAEIGWLAGLLPQRIAAPTERPPEEPEEAPADERPPEGPTARERARQALALVRSEGFLGHTWRTIVRLLRSFSVDAFSLWLRFGTGDPAQTGRLYGRMQAAMPAAHASRRLAVDLDPDFDREVFEGGGALVLSARPLRLIWTALVYALSPTTIRAVRAAWRARPDA